MDVKMVTPLLSALNGSTGVTPAQAAKGVGAAGKAAQGAEFSKSLQNALQSVSNAQNESNRLQQDFQRGVEGVSLEQTMMSMQQSQIAFQAALTVRNRLVSAYTDIMNMQV